MATPHRRVAQAEWIAEAERLFAGKKSGDWRFVCPVCGHSQSPRDFKDAGVPDSEIETMVGFSCIGRVLSKQRDAFGGKGPGPCNYAGGGLFKLNPVTVFTEDGREQSYFEWDRSGVSR